MSRDSFFYEELLKKNQVLNKTPPKHGLQEEPETLRLWHTSPSSASSLSLQCIIALGVISF